MSNANQTRDMQAIQLGINSAASVNQLAVKEAGVIGATTTGPPPTVTLATSHLANGPNDLAAQVIVSTKTSATWAAANVIWATILSNTAANPSTATIDDWKNFSDNTGGQTPFASSQYIILPATMPFKYIGLTDSVAAVSGLETGSAPGGNEYTTNGLGRAVFTTFSHSAGAATGTLGYTFTYTGAVVAVIGRSFVANSITPSGPNGQGNFGMFWDQLNGASGFQVASNGDTLQVTYTITFALVP